MDKLLAIIDSCTTAEQLSNFYDYYIMKTAMDEQKIWMLKGAYELKKMQIKTTFEANYKRERFPCTDEQPPQVIE